MIRSIGHRGLLRLFERGDRSKIRPDLVEKVERILSRLDAAATIDDMNLPGFGLHRLRGEMRGIWAVTVSRNWRIIFRFDGDGAFDVDLVDYH